MPFDGRELSETTQGLINSKRYIEKHGWCQKAVEDRKGRVCLVGAFFKASYDKYSEVRQTFCDANHLGINQFIKWNNARGRTKEEVLAAFDKAIAYSLEHQEETAPA